MTRNSLLVTGIVSAFALSTALLLGCGSGQTTTKVSATAKEADTTAIEEDQARAEARLQERKLDLENQAAELERDKDLAQREVRVHEREHTVTQREREIPVTRERVEVPTTPTPTYADRTQQPTSNAQPAEPAVVRVTVPASTPIEVEFSSDLSSETSQVGDTFRASVTQDVIADGWVTIPAGSEVLGTVSQVVDSKKIGGQAKLGLTFDQVQLRSGDTVPIQATLLEAGKSQTKKDAATIGGAAAGGAVLGRILSKNDKGKGTVLGAIVGGAVGTAIAAKKPGDPVTINTGMVATLNLDQPIEVAVKRSQRATGVAVNR